MNFFKLLLLVAVAYSLSSCGKKYVSSTMLWGGEVELILKLKSVYLAKSYKGPGKKYIVYGDVSMEGKKKKLDNFSLSCISLSFPDGESEKTYLDSLNGSGLTENYPAKNNILKASLYWAFPKDYKPDITKDVEIKMLRDIEDCLNAGKEQGAVPMKFR